MTMVFVLTIMFALIGLVAQWFGVDTRPGVNDPPERWIGQRSQPCPQYHHWHEAAHTEGDGVAHEDDVCYPRIENRDEWWPRAPAASGQGLT